MRCLPLVHAYVYSKGEKKIPIRDNIQRKWYVDLSFADYQDGNLTIRKEDNPIKVTAIFSSDVQLVITLNNSLADITLLLSQDFKGRTKGLLGEL